MNIVIFVLFSLMNLQFHRNLLLLCTDESKRTSVLIPDIRPLDLSNFFFRSSTTTTTKVFISTKESLLTSQCRNGLNCL